MKIASHTGAFIPIKSLNVAVKSAKSKAIKMASGLI